MRYYISTPGFETFTLRNLCLSVESALTSKAVDRSAVDLEDARAIVQSYIRIFSPPLTLEIHAPHLLDISTLLFEFAYDNLAPKYMQDLIPDMMKAALARLWLEYDAEQDEIMPPQRRGFSRRYMGDMCHYIRYEASRSINAIFMVFQTHERKDDWRRGVINICTNVVGYRHSWPLGAYPLAYN